MEWRQDVHRWAEAAELLQHARKSMVQPGPFLGSRAATALGRSRHWHWALQLAISDLALMDGRMALGSGSVGGGDPATCNAAATWCGRCYQWRRALSLMQLVVQSKARPDSRSYGAAVGACEKGLWWAGALHLLQGALSLSVVAGVIVMNTAASACGKAGQWPWAFWMLAACTQLALESDRVSFNIGLTACAVTAAAAAARAAVVAAGACGQQHSVWRWAQQVLETAQCHAVEPDITAFNAGILSCPPSARGWSISLALLVSCLSRQLRADEVTMGSLVGVMEARGSWRSAVFTGQRAEAAALTLDATTSRSLRTAKGRELGWRGTPRRPPTTRCPPQHRGVQRRHRFLGRTARLLAACDLLRG